MVKLGVLNITWQRTQVPGHCPDIEGKCPGWGQIPGTMVRVQDGRQRHSLLGKGLITLLGQGQFGTSSLSVGTDR